MVAAWNSLELGECHQETGLVETVEASCQVVEDTEEASCQDVAGTDQVDTEAAPFLEAASILAQEGCKGIVLEDIVVETARAVEVDTCQEVACLEDTKAAVLILGLVYILPF